MEEEIHLVFGNEKVPVHRDNVSLWTFLGRTAAGHDASNYDHIFVVLPAPEGEDHPVRRIWKHDTCFEEMAEYIQRHNYPQNLFISRVPEQDVQAFEAQQFEDINRLGSFPEEWVDDGS